MSVEPDRYVPGAIGWVGRHEFTRTRKDGRTVTTASYWYGPRGLSNGWGSLDYSVAVFGLRRDCVAAMRDRGARGRPTKVIAAEMESAPRWRSWWEEKLASIGEPLTTRKGDRRLADMLTKADPRGYYEANPHEVARWRSNWTRAVDLLDEA